MAVPISVLRIAGFDFLVCLIQMFRSRGGFIALYMFPPSEYPVAAGKVALDYLNFDLLHTEICKILPTEMSRLWILLHTLFRKILGHVARPSDAQSQSDHLWLSQKNKGCIITKTLAIINVQ